MAEPLIPLDHQYVSKEQFCKICHIGKQTALRLIESGLIPAIDTHMQTNRYLISTKDIQWYLHEREQCPEKFGHKHKLFGVMEKYDAKAAKRMQTIAQSLWESQAELLTAYEVAALLGYRHETIYRWRIRFDIKVFVIEKTLYIPKRILLDFVASPEFHGIERKSDIHLDLIRRAYCE